MSEESDGTDAPVLHEAFQLFAHELRLEILLALDDAQNYSLTFVELQSEVDEQDSGKFSYHLSKLEGVFVEKVEEQYVLTYPGHRVIDASRTAAFNNPPEIQPYEVEGTCPTCGAAPEFNYEDHIGTVACQDCGDKLVEYPVDPGAFYDRSIDKVIDAFDRWVKATWRLASDGTCFACAGPVLVSFTEAVDGLEYAERYQDYYASDHPVLLELDCQNCSFYSYIPTGARVLDNPAVLGNIDTDSIDIRNSKIWELPFIIDGSHVSVVDIDPWDVRVRIPMSDGYVEAHLGDDTSVTAVTEHL